MPQTLASRVKGLLRASLGHVLAMGLILTTSAERAQTQGPPPTTKNIILAEPGVLFISTTIRICIRSRHTTALKCYRENASGSGFAVNPDGLITTASHVVGLDEKDRALIKNHAANRLFGVPRQKNDDPYEQYHLTDPRDNRRLQACYAGSTCEFSITPTVRVYPAAQIAGLSPRPIGATALRQNRFSHPAIAILKVDTRNLPTVPLALSVADVEPGQAVTALGFPGSAENLPTGRSEPTKTFGRVSNVPAGVRGTSWQQIEVDLKLKNGMSGGPVIDSNGKVIGLTSSSLLGDHGTAKQSYIRTTEDIRGALNATSVKATRGEVDTLFALAMKYYWDRYYSAALPLHQKVLNLHDGHPLAKRYLALAQAKAGGPDEKPSPAGPSAGAGGWNEATLILVSGIVMVFAALIVVVRRRRRASATTDRG